MNSKRNRRLTLAKHTMRVLNSERLSAIAVGLAQSGAGTDCDVTLDVCVDIPEPPGGGGAKPKAKPTSPITESRQYLVCPTVIC